MNNDGLFLDVFFLDVAAILMLAAAVLLLVVASVLGVLLWRTRCHNTELETGKTLVFDFLHNLGAAFSEDVHSHELHRLVVESIVRIVKTNSGALYVLDK